MVMEVLYLLVVWVAWVLTQCYSDICCSGFAVHLWRYRGGYPALTECLEKLNNNKVDYKFISSLVSFSLLHRIWISSKLILLFKVHLTHFCFYSQLFIYFLISQKHVYLSSGVFRVSEREGKNVDFEAKSAPPGVQFLEWTFSQTRPQHLWNAHISSQGIYITYIKTAWLVFLWISLHRFYLSSKRLLCTL